MYNISITGKCSNIAKEQKKVDNRVFGRIGENAAADVLRAKGYKIVRQNYRCRYGEIDIIAEKYGEVSFVEVKTRQGLDFGRPCEAVTEKKKQHLRKAAYCYLREMRDRGDIPRRYGFQVFEVIVNQIEDAF